MVDLGEVQTTNLVRRGNTAIHSSSNRKCEASVSNKLCLRPETNHQVKAPCKNLAEQSAEGVRYLSKPTQETPRRSPGIRIRIAKH